MRRSLAVAALGVTVLVGACGGGPGAAKKTALQTAAAPAAPATTVSAAPAARTAAPSAKSTPTTGATRPPVTTARKAASAAAEASPQPAPAELNNQVGDKPPLPMSAHLSSACVRPGEAQSIVITTLADSAVGYDAVYADGKNGMSAGYYGGNKGGRTDANGGYQDTWTIAPGAPAGPTRVDVAGANANGEIGQISVAFAVADLQGKCG